MSKAQINPMILKWARESCNFTIEEVAHRLNKSAELIKSWEEGQDAPTYLQLEKLAYEVYKRPIAVFFFPQPPLEEIPRKSFRTLPEIEYQKLSPALIKQFRKAQAMQINLNELCDGKSIAKKKIIEEISVTSTKDIRQVVEKIRDYIGIDLKQQKSWENVDLAFDSWRNAIEKCGVFIFKDAFKNDDVSGFCLYDIEFPVIYINNSMPRTRQIFTVFHELGHLLFKTSGIDKIKDDYLGFLSENDRQIEIFCNKFAAEFLVPSYDFDQQIVNLKINDDSITVLAKKYAVSREVILRKFFDRGLVDESYYSEKADKWIQEAKESRNKSGGNYYATKAVYLGDNYLNIAFREYYKNRIDSYQLANYLDIKVDNISGLETAFNRRELH